MDDWVLRMPWRGAQATESEPLLTREWLVTNGLGGYASGTIIGAPTRRYHGMLISALPAPFGRQMMLNYLSELVRFPAGPSDEADSTYQEEPGSTRIAGRSVTARFGGEEHVGSLELHGAEYLCEFRLEMGLPVWHYQVGTAILEKRLLLPHGQNTVHVNYRLVAGDGPVRLKLRPAVHFRSHDAHVSKGDAGPYVLTLTGPRMELSASVPLPPLRLYLYGERPAFTGEGQLIEQWYYRVEADRGYDSRGELWSPGYFRADLSLAHDVTLVASTESWDTILALGPAEALEAERTRRAQLIAEAHPALRTGPGSQLVLAADQFIISPAGRIEDQARARAAGDGARTVIAGYHWFTDWGRDTMISLEGLTLTTHRHIEAGFILRTFGQAIRDGLIPNLFPEGARDGLYHTADATLWYFHALERYLTATDDRATLRLLLPKLVEIVEHHFCGTQFGIGVDPEDGLLRQGAPGYQLTWMDAKVGDWVVTPRRGKTVEINALWYNALRLLSDWVESEQDAEAASYLKSHAELARRSFNARFWYREGNYLYDVVDGEGGDDSACRPNQLLAISLSHAVLDPARWEAVLETCTQRLLTPLGLRTLAPGHPDYKPNYFGDLRARDAAYHQGTVWSWLIGPYIDAWLKVHPSDPSAARRFLDGLIEHLGEACLGSISEVFDAEAPFTPRGCIAQAWGVAEVLRCWVKTAK